MNRYIRGSVGSKWHDLGIELLERDDVDELDKIKVQYPQDLNECCKAMFQLWLRKQSNASWNQLIEALRQPGIELDALASKVEQILLQPKPKPGQCMFSFLPLYHEYFPGGRTQPHTPLNATRNFYTKSSVHNTPVPIVLVKDDCI